jgi:hypothetical protein
MGTTAGVLFALGVTKGAAVNFALASGLLLTSAALAAGALGLGGSLLLTLRARRPLGALIPANDWRPRGRTELSLFNQASDKRFRGSPGGLQVEVPEDLV